MASQVGVCMKSTYMYSVWVLAGRLTLAAVSLCRWYDPDWSCFSQKVVPHHHYEL